MIYDIFMLDIGIRLLQFTFLTNIDEPYTF